jgi:hypothetical protein
MVGDESITSLIVNSVGGSVALLVVAVVVSGTVAAVLIALGALAYVGDAVTWKRKRSARAARRRALYESSADRPLD